MMVTTHLEGEAEDFLEEEIEVEGGQALTNLK